MVNDTQAGIGLSPDERQQIREEVMAQLRPYAFPDTRFVYDISQFLPAYAGYESLTDTLPALPFWAGSGPVYSTPDNCLEFVRSRLIADRRPLLQTIAVRLGFRYFAPGSVDPGFERLAGTLDGAALLSAPIDLTKIRDLGPLDFVITGCRAVTRQGVRFGKGYGYFDLEWGIMSELGIVNDATPVVVACHDVQVLDMDLAPSPVDTLVDWIVTPTESIEVKRTRPKPLGIRWDRLQPHQWDSTPVLTELKAMS